MNDLVSYLPDIIIYIILGFIFIKVYRFVSIIKNPTDYKGKYQIWQYTSTGKINGISGDVDLNIGYKKYL